MSNRQKLYLLIPLFWLCLVCPVLFRAHPASAQSQAVLDNIEANSAGWNNLTNSLIFGAGTGLGLNGQLWQIASLVGVLSIFFYLFVLGRDMLDGKQSLKSLAGPFFFILFMMFLLGAPGDVPPASRAAFDVLQIKDKFLQITLESSIAGQNLGAAITDELLNATTQEELRLQVVACDNIPAVPVALPSQERPVNPNPPLSAEQVAYYDKLACYGQVAQVAEQKLATIEAECQLGECPASRQRLENLRDGLTTAALIPVGQGPTAIAGNPFIQRHILVPAIMFLTLQFQRFFIMTLNAIYFLSLLILPIPLAASLTPRGGNSLLSSWATVFFGTMLAEFFYIIIISTSSLILSSAQTTGNNDDLITAVVLGFFGPLLSGFAAKANVSGAIRGVGSAVGQAASSLPVVGGTVASFARYRSG